MQTVDKQYFNGIFEYSNVMMIYLPIMWYVDPSKPTLIA